MVYAGSVGQRELTLGVSGRLMKSNLIMWDPETATLWSQIKGEALHGPLAGQRLDMIPAQFVSFGTWRKLYPQTVVLDMSHVPTTAWYFTGRDLAKGQAEGRRGKRPLAIGLRRGDDVVAVSLQLLHRKGLVETSLEKVPILVVWLPEESAAFVYLRRLGTRELHFGSERDDTGAFRDAAGNTWDLLRGIVLAGPAEGATLERHAYIPTYIAAWRSYYPKSPVLR